RFHARHRLIEELDSPRLQLVPDLENSFVVNRARVDDHAYPRARPGDCGFAEQHGLDDFAVRQAQITDFASRELDEVGGGPNAALLEGSEAAGPGRGDGELR